MEKRIKTKQKLKAKLDLAESKAAINQGDTPIESPDKFVLFTTEEDGLMKLFKKQQEKIEEIKKKKNNHLGEPFDLDDIF